jgi:hypothetical protein
MDINQVGEHNKMQISELEEWRDKAIMMPLYTKKEPSSGTTEG